MAEKQSAHRQGMERKFLNFNGISQILGVVFAGLIVMGAIALGGYLVYNDKSLQGFVAMFVPLATVGGLFIHDRRQQQKELERKRATERR
jgi:uncharacterized membrane protein